MKTSSAKAKGRRLQEWVCDRISEILNEPWGKDEVIASREMGQTGVDVRLVGSALKRFPFSIECKNQEKWNIPGWIRQAKKNTIPNTDWLLIVTKNKTKDHKNPIVVLDAVVFFNLLNQLVYHVEKGDEKR